MRYLRMNLDFTEMLAELKLLLRTQILVAEENDTALSDKESELVSLLVSQVLELQANNLSANVSSQVFNFFRSGEEGGLVLVSAGAGVGVLAVMVADGVDVLQVERASWTVLACC